MKFKVGDKVKVVKAKFTCGCSDKQRYIGKIVAIVDVRNGDTHQSNYDIGDEYWWYEDELELVSFTKADLKDGMVVELRKGLKALFLNDTFMTENDTWLSAKDYDEDLTYNNDKHSHPFPEYDVCKVFKSNAYTINSIFKKTRLNLIWERPEPAKKMTVEEIEKELGYKVEIVSDTNNQ